MNDQYSKKILLIALINIACITATFAQSQPPIQTAGVRAPANIKIDGELKEWPNKKLSAYDKGGRIYYAVSNDDENLYLTIRGNGPLPAFKILKEGVAFTISHSLDKAKRAKDPQNVLVNFPNTQPNGALVSSMMVPIFAVEPLMRDSVKNKKQIDSLTALSNERIGRWVKEIKVKGIKEITDTLLSVYNETGIKGVLRISKSEPIIEMAIPLKYLGLTIASPVRVSYNIKLPVSGGNFNMVDFQKSGVSAATVEPDLLYRFTATEFWGEYTLVGKKP